VLWPPRAALRHWNYRSCGFIWNIAMPAARVFSQYRILNTEGIPVLAEGYLARPERVIWDDSAVREKLWTSILSLQQTLPEQKDQIPAMVRPDSSSRGKARVFAGMAIAAGLLLAVAHGAYYLGARTQHKQEVVSTAPTALEEQYQKLRNRRELPTNRWLRRKKG